MTRAAGRKRRATSIGAFALALLIAAIGAATASAEPLEMRFTEARANVGTQLSVANDADVLFEAPWVAPFAAELDPETGEFDHGVLGVPEFTTILDDPPNTEVTVQFIIGPITGSFDEETGILEGSGMAGGLLTATPQGQSPKQCLVSTGETPLTLSSAGSTGGDPALEGETFTDGLTGYGAIAGGWADMTAEPVGIGAGTICADVEEAIGGAGGIWLEHEGEDPPLPPVCVVPELAGKTLPQAKQALKAADCTLGVVKRPLKRKGKKLRRPLLVRSSDPDAGATPEDGLVELRMKQQPKLSKKAKKAKRARR